ncbi:uncharacterized protein KIAA0040 homolog [Esox lucius]|uniref:KIAA0040 n=1 Tax=Esox lucius TaxID=8010 RepID=A0A3P8Y1S0_ESOLU|nr:uncharacterized protein KIAA0040 homolog [Esox lucius]XP_010889629.1 uncharacterized protein KIAA0040 homolog [Esox lucius]XP_034147364.1 uncharacterized protein KIAA0040 homolog [Esox lucius]
MKEEILNFFCDLWRVATAKHDQGVYNTVCLVVLLALPMVVLLTSLVVCCHCCCCRQTNRACCCRGSPGSAMAKSEKKKKKRSPNSEDLWISVKAGPMTPDRVALTMV